MIYLDYNATHPPFREIIERANQKYMESYGNSSGASSFSQKSRQLVEMARKGVARTLSVHEEQIIFTSSATEANFLSIQMICGYLKEARSKTKLSIAVSPLEHPSITEALGMVSQGEIMFLPLDQYGRVDLVALERSLLESPQDTQPPPDLIVCGLVHNETGIIQPGEKLFELARKFTVPLICDAVQAVPRLQEGVLASGLTPSLFSASMTAPVFFTLGGHKIGAGFGTGVIITPRELSHKSLAPFTPFYSGRQEFSLRPGSHNVASIIAFEETLREKIKKKRIIKS